MNIKTAVIIFSLFLLGSFFFLSLKQRNQANFDANKDWWAIYFSDPKSADLDYVIENHSQTNNFHVEIFLQKNKVSQSDVVLNKGESRTFSVTASDIVNKKITISVTSGNQTKEINKVLP